MTFTKEEKEKFLALLKELDLQEIHVPEGAKREWFKFGAFEAIRIMTEKVLIDEKR